MLLLTTTGLPRLRSLLLAAAFLPLLTIPSTAFPGEAKIRFGYQQTLWGAPAAVAIHERVFEEQGIQVEGVMFGAGKEGRDALIAGRIDIVSLGGTPFLVGATKADLVAIAMVAYAGKTLGVVARPDAGLESLSDLRGRNVASKVGTLTDHVFRTVVAPDFGLRPGDYRIVNVAFQDHVAALAGGAVDAFAGVEPFVSLAVINGIGTRLVDFGGYDYAPLVLAAKGSFVREHPGEVTSFLRGWKKVLEIFRDDGGRAARIMEETFHASGYDLPPGVVARGLEKMEVTTEYRPGLIPYFQKQAASLQAEGKIDTLPDWQAVLVTEPKKTAGLP